MTDQQIESRVVELKAMAEVGLLNRSLAAELSRLQRKQVDRENRVVLSGGIILRKLSAK